jgi:alginate O-acetyltransferase complex protein AlgJ
VPELSRDEVLAVYRQVLGRTPDEPDVEYHLNAWPTLDAFLRAVLDSEEYGQILRDRGMAAANNQAIVNVYHPDLSEFGLPPGTRSDDEIAIVGREGWLFLCGGTNANLAQYVGREEMAPGWLGEWQDAIHRREPEARELGVAAALMVVPDKLAVYEEHYPEPLDKVGPRPVERLLGEAGLPIVYPLAELRAAAESAEVYLRTDTHLSFRGNQVLGEAALAALGVEQLPDLDGLEQRRYPIAGDLGVKFAPQIVGVVEEPGSLHRAEIVADNRAEIEAVGGHIGTRRVFRNESAPDRRLAVLFGDSFGFAAAYYQGLAWFMAQVFREVHFVWVPFGWDPDYVRRVGAEAVLVQGAERFVARVPHLRVETARLAEETLRRKQALGVEEVFD